MSKAEELRATYEAYVGYNVVNDVLIPWVIRAIELLEVVGSAEYGDVSEQARKLLEDLG